MRLTRHSKHEEDDDDANYHSYNNNSNRVAFISRSFFKHHSCVNAFLFTGLCPPLQLLATPGRSGCDASQSDRCHLCTTDHAFLLRQRTLRKDTDEAHICWLPVEGQQRCGWRGRQVADRSLIAEVRAVSHCCGVM